MGCVFKIWILHQRPLQEGSLQVACLRKGSRASRVCEALGSIHGGTDDSVGIAAVFFLVTATSTTGLLENYC